MQIIIEFEKKPLLFSGPEDIITCSGPEHLEKCFEKIESALSKGYYLAGYLSYEAGYAFENKLAQNMRYDVPLIHFGVYKKPDKRRPAVRPGAAHLLKMRGPSVTKQKYFEHINAIRDYIAAGDVYQITYCKKFRFDFDGDHYSLYRKLLKNQPVPYPAYIDMGDTKIMSLSPEMFIKKNGVNVRTKPMKGTWPRGGNIFTDFIAGLQLKYDLKNRAENVMIADLLRNDLGRIGVKIRAPKLFEVAKYTTLCQMTSTVTGTVDKNIKIHDIFKSLHPSGSVTGAPKIRAMEIIRELEREHRHIYTGAIGYITPQRDMFFNVPIRTLLIRGKEGEMGVGGGIVWDSTPEGEYAEAILKAKFLFDVSG